MLSRLGLLNTPTAFLQRVNTSHECPIYDTKQFDGEGLIIISIFLKHPVHLKWYQIYWNAVYICLSRSMTKVMNYHIFKRVFPLIAWGCPRGIIVKAMDCGIVVSEFVLQLRYYVHFRANTLGKGMNPLILPAYGLNSTTTVLLGEWIWH